jgi:hypothetical protein
VGAERLMDRPVIVRTVCQAKNRPDTMGWGAKRIGSGQFRRIGDTLLLQTLAERGRACQRFEPHVYFTRWKHRRFTSDDARNVVERQQCHHADTQHAAQLRHSALAANGNNASG